MNKLCIALAIGVLVAGVALTDDAASTELRAISLVADQAIYVNGTRLEHETVVALERAYGVRLRSGNFWYDPASGLWGLWGGPAAGQIHPGLKLGGPLQFDASGGRTNIALNGRAIHPLEYRAILATYGYAVPGRYWLDARGNVGLEGGPFLFNAYAATAQQGKQWYRAGSGGASNTYMGGQGGCVWAQVGGESYMSGC